jgi:hypothetical protein
MERFGAVNSTPLLEPALAQKRARLDVSVVTSALQAPSSAPVRPATISASKTTTPPKLVRPLVVITKQANSSDAPTISATFPSRQTQPPAALVDPAPVPSSPLPSTASSVQASPTAATTVRERCAFYPNCKKVSCPFHHPSEPCKFYPSCQFGTNCLYVHPSNTTSCRFGLHCMNKLCPFVHPTMPCRFGALCRTAACAFEHKCKFDVGCKKSGCNLKHPKRTEQEAFLKAHQA